MLNKRIGLACLSLLLVSSLALAGCGGDDDDDDDPTRASTSTATARPSATNASGDEGDDDDDGDDASPSATSASGDDDDDDVEFDDVTKDTSNLTYRVSYEVEDTDGDGVLTKYTYTIANKPPKYRLDLVDSTDPSESVLFVQDDKTLTSCTPEDKSCIQLDREPGDDNDLGFAFDVDKFVKEAEEEGATVKKLDDRKIAGQDSTCYNLEDADGAGVVCLTKKDGIVMMIDGVFDDQTSKLIATEYSTDVSDDDVSVPSDYTVETFDADDIDIPEDIDDIDEEDTP